MGCRCHHHDVALTYTIDPASRIVVITGEYSDRGQWEELASRLFADPAFGPGYAFLRDLRNARVTATDTNILEVFDLVRKVWPRIQATRAAIVTRRDDATSAMMTQALADGEHLPIRAFDSLDLAMEWLRDKSQPR